MKPLIDDTIFALSSGRLPAGIAVVRLSGPAAFTVARGLVGTLPPPRQMSMRSIRIRSGETIDRGMVVVFPSPHSFTGEDSVEFHLHGSRAVVAAFAQELGSTAGVRQAEAGEFSQRAFRNGKFDLTAAEALGDLIEAETEAQRRFAIDNAAGRNAILYGSWREKLLHGRALIEAELDFPDEDDVPGSVSGQVWRMIEEMAGEIRSHIETYHRGEIIRDGFRVTIVGAPNAGKSSLLNALARRDVAIVSSEPGTTRDLVTVELNLAGIKVIVTDTAGVRDGAGIVEQQGIARAREAAKRADLILLVEEGPRTPGLADFLPETKPVILVRSKIDLPALADSRETSTGVAVSTVTGEGLEVLVHLIGARAETAVGAITDPMPFRERHVIELKAALAALQQFLDLRDDPLELAAEQLRLASDHLARIVGSIDVEDLLDVVFSRFCIGK
ncbi:tRNA uridine-5-carboxymethylaminomethyl(34) synthesis GTPase MnmE [Aquibium sp. ELW1220]|uniref:tRNA uridine-5-carboxymethylaminomethyl(34) synthesis GTPase MnmE n=1 Tax=Aquibium sp. ELW1220 TaxID=2976766 RepID=UPI0025B26298|nr:tRNA uridine-5-carboxymethylaminomethyl(34) synthesis GTPase MnmE [Aquibium sp. ELW1220]MDN2578811.1 tRNA uridine-5-carboxymethylaminomethyl(34) synthesis GTPase MnmE [Aquibium sp. ELW1220]